MSLNYVKPGETVKASTVNSIIDVLGGEQSPSPDLDFKRTPRGAQLSLQSKYGGPNKPTPLFLQARPCTAGSSQTWQLNLGKDLDDCKSSVTYYKSDSMLHPREVALVFGNGSSLSAVKLRDEDYTAATGGLIPGTGFIETPISADSGRDLYAQYWQQMLSSGSTSSLTETSVGYFVVTDTSSTSDIEPQLKSLMSDSHQLKMKYQATIVSRTSGQSGIGNCIQHKTGPVEIWSGLSGGGEALNLDSVFSKDNPETLSQFSIDQRTITAEISGTVTSADIAQMHHFDQLTSFEAVDNYTSTSAQSNFDFVLRQHDTEDGKDVVRLVYADLSDTVRLDDFVKKAVKVHSLDNAEDNEEGKSFFELRRFWDTREHTKEEDYDIVVRETTKVEIDGDEVEMKRVNYAKLEDVADSVKPKVDSQVTQQFSLQEMSDTGKKYFQIWNFDAGGGPTFTLDAEHSQLPSNYTLLVRNGDNKTVEYADLVIDISSSLSALSSALSTVISSEISTVVERELSTIISSEAMSTLVSAVVSNTLCSETTREMLTTIVSTEMSSSIISTIHEVVSSDMQLISSLLSTDVSGFIDTKFDYDGVDTLSLEFDQTKTWPSTYGTLTKDNNGKICWRELDIYTPNPPEPAYDFETVADTNTLAWNSTTGWEDAPFALTINSNGATVWRPLAIAMPPEPPDYGQDIQNINDSITSITSDISDIDDRLTSLEDDSLKHWVQEEDHTHNYGQSIGDSNRVKVIDLDSHTLAGGSGWSVESNLTVELDMHVDSINPLSREGGGVDVNGRQLKAGDWTCPDGGFRATQLSADGGISIGETMINEDILIALKALVVSENTIVDRINAL